jgi:hypothetical protein
MLEKNKKFDRMYAMDELKKVFAKYGFEQIEFLQLYHPFRFVTKGSAAGVLANSFCTSFAIKGRKQH